MGSRIAIVAGVCTRHDAISNVVRHQERVLREAGHEVSVLTHHTDFPGGSHVEVTDAWMLQRYPEYTDADLVILHFGIQYGLFDSLLLRHPRARRIVHFHNVTPPELLGPEARVQAEKGIRQASIIDRADSVWSDSTHNTECLLEWSDVQPEAVVPMPLFVPDGLHAQRSFDRPGDRPEVVELLYVGRLTASKGVAEVVRAVAGLPAHLSGRVRLRLAGSTLHSDGGYIDSLGELIERSGMSERAELVLDADDGTLHGLYDEAHVFVTATRHEGFCVPVVEALSAGCHVVATDVGAVAETLGRCGTLVPPDDLGALGGAVAGSVEDVLAGRRTCGPDEVAAHLEQFTPKAFAERTLRQVDLELAAARG